MTDRIEVLDLPLLFLNVLLKKFNFHLTHHVCRVSCSRVEAVTGPKAFRSAVETGNAVRAANLWT